MPYWSRFLPPFLFLITLNGCGETAPPLNAPALIDSLENHNVPPQIVKRRIAYPAVFTEDYDWREQDRVWRSLTELYANAEKAWPEMVNHLDDSRYCITFNISMGGANYTIGDVLAKIMDAYLSEPYFRHVRPLGSQLAFSWLGHSEFMEQHDEKAWCEQRSQKTLYELQVEMCEWAIVRIRKLPDNVLSEEARAKLITEVEKEIESLRRSKRPVVPPPIVGNSLRWGLYTPDEAEQIRSRAPRVGSDP